MASPKKRKEYDRAVQGAPSLAKFGGPTFVKSSDKGKVDRSVASMRRIYQAFGSRHPSKKTDAKGKSPAGRRRYGIPAPLPTSAPKGWRNW